jgi:hypothetical protein
MDTNDAGNLDDGQRDGRHVERQMGPLVNVGNFGTRQEAEIARGVLQENGIPAFVQGGEMATTMFFVGTALGGVVLQSPESLAEEARRILADEFRSTDSIPAWKCPKCSADVDAGFEVCWRCGEQFGSHTRTAELTADADKTTIEHPPSAFDLADEATPSETGSTPPAILADEPEGDEIVNRALRSAVFGAFLFPTCVFIPIAFLDYFEYWILTLYLLVSLPFTTYSLYFLGDARNVVRSAGARRRLILAHLLAYSSVVVFPALVLYVFYIVQPLR